MEKEKLLSIGVIGTGNCGGQMALAASKKGFDIVAMNAATKDLALLPDNIAKFCVGDGNGTGKSRENAKMFMAERLNVLMDDVMTKFFDEHDVVVIATSASGGFGSGSSLEIYEPLSEMYPEKLFIVAGVLPFDSEALVPHTHAIQWLQELEKMEATYMLYDNGRFPDRNPEEVCRLVNEEFANDLCVLRGDFIDETRTGGIDNRDMITAISPVGRIVVGHMEELDESDIVEDSLAKTIAAHIKNTSFHADMLDDKEIRATAVMYTLHENFTPYTVNLKKSMNDTFGTPVADYDNFANVGEDNPNKDHITVVLSGLNSPVLRINKLVAITEAQAKEQGTSKKTVSRLGSLNLTGVASLSAKELTSGTVAPVRKTPDRAAILRKHAAKVAVNKPATPPETK